MGAVTYSVILDSRNVTIKLNHKQREALHAVITYVGKASSNVWNNAN